MAASERAAARAAGELLLELCERARPEISGATLADAYPEAGRVLLDWGALKPAANLSAVLCRACAEQHFAEVEFEPESRTYRQFCAEAGWVKVLETDLRTYTLDFGWLLGRLAAALGTDEPGRIELIESALWQLGETRTGECDWTALFARRLGEEAHLERLVAVLADRAWPGPALILTTSDDLGVWIKLPPGIGLLRLREVMSVEPGGLHLDHRMIVAAITKAAGPTLARTGMAGRPSARNVYLGEHRRRLKSGEAHARLADEARALLKWMREAHPHLPSGSFKTIGNNIRDQHRRHFPSARN